METHYLNMRRTDQRKKRKEKEEERLERWTEAFERVYKVISSSTDVSQKTTSDLRFQNPRVTSSSAFFSRSIMSSICMGQYRAPESLEAVFSSSSWTVSVLAPRRKLFLIASLLHSVMCFKLEDNWQRPFFRIN